MNCPNCQAEIDADSRFCKNCGAAIGQGRSPAKAPTAPTAPPAPSAPPAQAGDAYRDPANEQDVWTGRPSFRAHYGWWATWAVLSVLLLIAAYKWLPPGSVGRIIVWLLVAASGIALFVREALVVYGNRYRLTTQRLFYDQGILTRLTDQLELIRVDDVRLRQGIVDRIFDTGDVEVMGTDATDTRLVLQGVSEPAAVAEHLRRHVRNARGRQTLFVESV